MSFHIYVHEVRACLPFNAFSSHRRLQSAQSVFSEDYGVSDTPLFFTCNTMNVYELLTYENILNK